MKEETFNNPCENGFFVIESYLQEDRDLMDSYWILGSREALVYA